MLASAKPQQPAKPMMTYAVIGIMSMGVVGEVVNAVRSASFSDYGQSIMPLVLFVGAIVIAAQVYTRAATRKRSMHAARPMPTEEQHLVLNESGWHAAAVHEAEGATIRPWEELVEHRTGEHSLILVGPGSAFAAVPLRVLSSNQFSHLRRLLLRKLQRTVLR